MTEREILVHLDASRDPARNLAREEEIFEMVEGGKLPEVVRFWVNTECLVRGKAKSSKYGWYHEERAREMGVRVIERQSGGGVVYHDVGNLNWSFFLKTSGAFLSPTAAFDGASKHMVKALRTLGVQARFSPPNRIDVADRKVSGMAARSTVRTLLVHGTLLLDSDLEKLNLLCIPPAGCPPVANIGEWVKGVDAAAVMKALAAVLGDSGFRVRMVGALP
jgi:lipoate-protein ligase A